MNEENAVFLLGYKNSTRRYLLQIAIACVVLSLLLLVLFNQVSAIPLLLTGASLAGELWWNSRKSLKLLETGLLYGDQEIPWHDILRYTSWGPFGIPLTPIKIQGITIYFQEESFCIYSTSDGYNTLLKKLESLKFPEMKDPVWYQYPKRIIRVLRYVVAFSLSLIFLLVFALSLLVILAVVVGGYFLFRSLVKSKREGSQTLPEDAWVAGAGSIVLFCVVYYIFQSPYLIFCLGILPLAAIIWFPWHPQPLSIISDALFIGKKEAYPLRHLRTSRIIPRLFIFKIWQLSFAHGDVNIFPFLENFEIFKKKLESSWDEVQRRYQGKKMSEEEATICTPGEEARKIYFFQADEISLQMPVAWQFLVPLFFLIHLLLLFSCLWCVYYTPLGKISLLGIFLTHSVTFFLLVYGGYILFALMPRFFSLYKKYYIDENGIKVEKKKILWSEIQSIVPYQTPDKRNHVSLFDAQGKMLLEISQDMSEWEMAMLKIRKKVEKVNKYDITESGAVALLARRASAWQRSWRILVVLAMLIALPFSVDSIITQKESLLQKGSTAVTMPGNYILPKLLGESLILIPYQDWQGEMWYALASPREKSQALSYMDSKIFYFPDNPLFITPCGSIQDPLISFLDYIEEKGFEIEHLVWMENLVVHSHYFFWGLAVILFFLALLHQDIFAGILTQKMPAPLGPRIYMHGSFVLQKSIGMLVHLGIVLILGFFAFYLHFPSWFSGKISFSFYFSEAWIILSILLPVLFCPYLVFYIREVIPGWLRSFQSWEIQEDGIRDKRTALKWEDIKSIAVLRLPISGNKKYRKVAMIYGNQGPGICLEGDLIHFNTILSHIRQQSHCKKDDYSRARYFYRKAWSIPKFFGIFTCILMILILLSVFSLGQSQQNALLEKGEKTLTTVHSALFKKFVFCSYQDKQSNIWYTIAWNEGETRQAEIIYNKTNPAFWQPLDNSLISWQEKVASYFPFLLVWEKLYSEYIYLGVFWITVSSLGLLLFPLLWHLLGILWGFPPLNPEKLEKTKKTEKEKK